MWVFDSRLRLQCFASDVFAFAVFMFVWDLRVVCVRLFRVFCISFVVVFALYVCALGLLCINSKEFRIYISRNV